MTLPRPTSRCRSASSPVLPPGSRSWHDPDLTIRPTGGNHRTPHPALANLRIIPPARPSSCTPRGERGCNQHADGVQPAQPRGAAIAPESPLGNHPPNRPPTPRARGSGHGHDSRRRAGRRVLRRARGRLAADRHPAGQASRDLSTVRLRLTAIPAGSRRLTKVPIGRFALVNLVEISRRTVTNGACHVGERQCGGRAMRCMPVLNSSR